MTFNSDDFSSSARLTLVTLTMNRCSRINYPRISERWKSSVRVNISMTLSLSTCGTDRNSLFLTIEKWSLGRKWTKVYVRKRFRISKLTISNIHINPYPWILENNPKRGTVNERVLRGKSRAHRCVFCAWQYMQNGKYFCSARHFNAPIGICHFKLAS